MVAENERSYTKYYSTANTRKEGYHEFYQINDLQLLIYPECNIFNKGIDIKKLINQFTIIKKFLGITGIIIIAAAVVVVLNSKKRKNTIGKDEQNKI